MATRDSTTRINFTHARVSAFACPEGKPSACIWDSGQPGLGLRARETGAVAFIFQRKWAGRPLRITIGDRETWTLAEARTEAKRLSALVDQGIDPRQEKAQRKAEADQARQDQARAVVTLGDAWDAYVEARQADWSESTRYDHDRAMTAPGQARKRSPEKTKAGALYPLRGERLADLTPERLATWMEREKAHRPTVAARGFRLLRTFLNWVAEQPSFRGLVDPGHLLTKTVRRSVPKPRAKSDCLQREQLRPWFEAVQQISNPSHRVYLQCLLLTGARRQELMSLRWEDVDFQWQALTIRDKVEGERIVPLPPYVGSLLGTLPRRNQWVFSSTTSESGRMSPCTRAHGLALQAAGLPHLTLHGLRRSFGTLSEWVECPVGVVAQIQGHKPSAIAEKHYRRRPLDLLRQWHTKIEAWILTEAGIPQPQDGAGRLRRVK
ncbi:tyrosine-type recombinase/integrase [Ectothiorhodospira variabilis]|uniref:tyrosine-type recombinase/integrase n=1 Tax=Ectothiorhodospira variabilis TaxID=505694 RepID=UPI001EFA804D|nr:integrase family protein [Ectothiorhodospira variabilis]MCG5495253.1 integrase family protein [Ectothiorhodospira variabilis]MCG5504197.1 integrase family protein [Ectothiorhodospira variabilis]MCG5507352.1 integrase family protein [Ectothiorhodospira variabilis]